ncbi:MAG: 3-phosphoshikimate 1-carboxyvinyltransferase [Pirellulales bacterium]|nr:3-phosphoshikimate 1-carboxyvinyltransferase [Pirellulales bacterium]
MQETITIRPTATPIHGTIRPPGSKSITNRALVCAALANGNSLLTGALDSDDTRLMIDALGNLGFSINRHEGGRILAVAGTGGAIPSMEADLFVGNSGTTMRFLAALASLGHGAFHLDGVPRMRERPIGDLLDALGELGTTAFSQYNNRCPPISVHANGLPGGDAVVRGSVSSQFLSGLLMASPYAKNRVRIRMEGSLVSKPYVRMTIGVMRAFGVDVVCPDDLSEFNIPNETGYISREYSIEPDASAASYFWAAAAITGGEVAVAGLSKTSLQGDVAFCHCLEKMGCQVLYGHDAITVRGQPLDGIDVDMNAISDTVGTLATVALFARGRTTIRNVAHIRHKETDRIKALATELRKLGGLVDEQPDGLTIIPGQLHGGDIATYDDHRMAMSLALAGLVVPNVVIHQPACTSKTYPGYFQDLDRFAHGD